MKEILYTTAIDKNNTLIRIENAIKGESYFCPLCKKGLIYRNSGKNGKGSRRPHFAHNELSPNCTAEGVLHYSFKNFLVEFLNNELAENHTLIMSWICENNKHINQVNLLDTVSSIKIEYNLKECRPDIALFDDEENMVAAIEVIVAHYPDDKVVKYYKENNIVLIKIVLSSEEDLNMIKSKIEKPNNVDYCLYPKCDNYNQAITSRKLYIYNGYCGSLYHHQQRKCFVEICSCFGKIKTLALTGEELEAAKNNGVNLKLVNSIDLKEEIVEFPCRRCTFERNKYRRYRRF